MQYRSSPHRRAAPCNKYHCATWRHHLESRKLDVSLWQPLYRSVRRRCTKNCRSIRRGDWNTEDPQWHISRRHKSICWTRTVRCRPLSFADAQILTSNNSCLPRTCPTYLVKAGDDCATIAASRGLSLAQLLSYNPALNMYCTNLIANTNICVGPSEAQYTPTTIPGATATKPNYATATVAPPGSVPFGTTKSCGKYYRINPGDYCQQISLNYTITVKDFQEINPSINANCTNLVPGLYYCVWPTANWNATAPNTTSTIAPPLAPTPSGSKSNCYEWLVNTDIASWVYLIHRTFEYQAYHCFGRYMLTCGNLVWHNVCPAPVMESTNQRPMLQSPGR